MLVYMGAICNFTCTYYYYYYYAAFNAPRVGHKMMHCRHICMYVCVLSQVNGKYIIKSGTDFRSFGKITLTFSECEKLSVGVEKIDIVSSIEEDSYVKDIVSKYMGNFTVIFKLAQVYCM